MTMRALTFSLLRALATAAPALAEPALPPGMARIPAGRYVPLFINGRPSVQVESFALDRHPVTRGEYLAFVRANPRWQRGRVARAFAGPGYLAAWLAPLSVGTAT